MDDSMHTMKRDLLADARTLRGEIRPLPNHEGFDDEHYSFHHYKGRTWLMLWFQLPDSESTGVLRKEIIHAS